MMLTTSAVARSSKPIETGSVVHPQPLTEYYLQRLAVCQSRSEKQALFALIQLCQWQQEINSKSN
ncbi:hypothetical protein [Vibrio metschnikovii]|uniref:hypothetical protein n=1 Tax=Vibrio metschnikovii TaxID=28172 RepID=UPI001302E7DA|nr:hypothetical protein [Vibrio metschnikovii]